MASSGNNLLVGLHRWAARQDENFTTEVLVHLLRHALAEEPGAAERLVSLLTGGRLAPCQNDLSGIDVCTQAVTDLGQPDIEVRTDDHLVYVEVKVESGLGVEQLRRYRTVLESSSFEHTTLVLLSRYSVAESEMSARPDVCLRWHEIGDLLIDLLEHDKFENADGRFLANQFVGFLRSKGMLMDRVGWEMASGVRSLKALMEVLGEAIQETGHARTRDGQWDSIGYYMHSEVRNEFWVGVFFEDPSQLVFCTHNLEINAGLWMQIDEGMVEECRGIPHPHRWREELDLGSEGVHFFARNRASQQACIEQFLHDSILVVRQAQHDG